MRLIWRWYNILTSYQGLLNVVCLCTIWCPGSKRSRSITEETSGRQLSLHELGVQGDGDVVTHQNSAGLKGSVPGQTEILAIDLGARRDPNPGVPPGILRRRRWPFHRKADFASHSPDREVAFH